MSNIIYTIGTIAGLRWSEWDQKWVSEKQDPENFADLKTAQEVRDRAQFAWPEKRVHILGWDSENDKDLGIIE